MYDTLGTAGILNCGATSNSNVNVDVVGDLPTACAERFHDQCDGDQQRDDSAPSRGYGLTTIDVGAPGENVYTTRIGGAMARTSGTSLRQPAHRRGDRPAVQCSVRFDDDAGERVTLRPGRLYIREKLFEGVDQVGNLGGQTVTGGRINAGTSMALIMDGCGTCPSPYNLSAQGVSVGTTVLGWNTVSGTTIRPTVPGIGQSYVDGGERSRTRPATRCNDQERCMAYEFQVRVECDDETSDYSPAFIWTSEGCCLAPTDVAAESSSDESIDMTWSEVFDAETYDVRYLPLGTSTWMVVPGNTEPSIVLSPLQPCTNYTMEVRAHCPELLSDWTTAVNARTSGCGACVDNVYCSSDANDASAEWIALVRIGAIDNGSASDGGYGDYTSASTDLALGMAHEFTLEPGYAGFRFNEWFRIWMDLDHDGSFDTESELVFDTQGRSNDPVNGSLIVPLTATLGPTRMRVVMQYNDAPEGPCVPNYAYGETEDYCVNLVVGPTAVGHECAVAETSIYPQPADQQLFVRLPDRYAA